jgi:two-component system cell cycle response regulator
VILIDSGRRGEEHEMNNTALTRIMESPQLPTLPAVAVRVLELTSRRDVELSEIAKAVEHDPAIATRVLKTVNSSFYGLTQRVGSIRQALAYLGLETVKGLVLGFSLARAFKGEEEVLFDFEDYWRRSIYSASAARALASIVKCGDADEAFLAALVQDVGMIALWNHYGDRYIQVLDLADGDHPKLSGLEHRHFDIDHAEIGAAMLDGWKFPTHIVDVVLLHHQGPEFAAQDEDMRRIVLLANMVAESLGPDPERSQQALQNYEECAATWFDLRRGTAFAVLKSITQHADELGRMFDLKRSSNPDVDVILEEADRLRRENRVLAPSPEFAENMDQLTGLPDRNAFQQRLLSVFETDAPTAILLVGIDGMREINREGGPGSGDAALAKVSEAVLRTCREAVGTQANVFRFVGAELAVVLLGDNVARAGILAERLRASIRLAPLADDRLGLLKLGASLGIATRLEGTRNLGTPDELLRAAMMAISEARRNGGDSIFEWGDGEPVALAA